MRRLLTYVGFLMALGFLAGQARAFSLNGPRAEWQTDRLGYNVNYGYLPQFGPMNLGEEYRWNSPDVHYAFSSDFINYFGPEGIAEVEKAISFLNELPPMSQLNLEDYPLRSQRLNHRAQVLNLLDLKSYTMTLLVQQMGLIDPTRYIFTLRSRWIGPGGAPTNYFVIKRNFDPITLQPSSVINGQLWTYITIIDDINGSSLVVNQPVDPLGLLGSIHAPVATQSGAGGSVGLVLGGFWTGLTRDDVGGLKYLYKRNNYNVENAPPGATGGGGGPWSIPGATNTNNLVDVALRGGTEKLRYVRVDFDSLMGSFFEPFTNSYQETIYVNAQPLKQNVQRSVQIPDLIFDADDVSNLSGEDDVIFSAWIDFQDWDNNNDINGSQATPNAGPGVIQPSQGTLPAFVITYNNVGPVFWNVWPFFLSEFDRVSEFFVWGSFDGSTNAPIVYPSGTPIELLEQEFLTRPWLPVSPPTNLTNAPPENGTEPPPAEPPPEN